jgi:hypothetical protein
VSQFGFDSHLSIRAERFSAMIRSMLQKGFCSRGTGLEDSFRLASSWEKNSAEAIGRIFTRRDGPPRCADARVWQERAWPQAKWWGAWQAARSSSDCDFQKSDKKSGAFRIDKVSRSRTIKRLLRSTQPDKGKKGT